MWCLSSSKVRIVSKYFCETDVVPPDTPNRPYSLHKGQSGHMYIVQEREFLNSGETVYKIGKSTNIKHRMPSYPKNSLIIIIVHTGSYDVHHVERQLIEHLKDSRRFVQRTDIGSEYFECSVVDLMNEYSNLQQAIYCKF